MPRHSTAFLALAALFFLPACKTMTGTGETPTRVQTNAAISGTAAAVEPGEYTVVPERAVFSQRSLRSSGSTIGGRSVILNKGEFVRVVRVAGHLAEVRLEDGRHGFMDRWDLSEVQPTSEWGRLIPVLGEDFHQPAFPVSRSKPPPVPVPPALIEAADESLDLPVAD